MLSQGWVSTCGHGGGVLKGSGEKHWNSDRTHLLRCSWCPRTSLAFHIFISPKAPALLGHYPACALLFEGWHVIGPPLLLFLIPPTLAG